MEIKDIIKLEDTSLIYKKLTANKKEQIVSIEKIIAQLNPEKHDVMDPKIRKKKTVKVDTKKNDEITGEKIYKETKIEVCRVAVPLQKILVERTVGFTFGIPVEYSLKSKKKDQKKYQDLFDVMEDIMHDNKMHYFDRKLARRVFSECEAAELWYFTLDDQGKPEEMKVKLLSPLLGDQLFPHRDHYGRMDGFARKYYVNDDDGKRIGRFDVYDKRYVYQYVFKDGVMVKYKDPASHGFTKVPVIHYTQEAPEWHDVQSAIDRVETLISNWGDTNDYFGSPSYFFKGKLKGFAEKGEQGRVYQGDENTEMRVLSWNNSPTSMKDELQNLLAIIFGYVQTPDISFDVMKDISNNTSGVAIRLMFTDAHMKVATKEELFGEMFTRRCNLICNGIVTSLKTEGGVISDSIANTIKIEPVFTPYLPKNEKEEIEMICTAVGSGIASKKEGIERLGWSGNAEETLTQILQEKATDAVEPAY